MRRRNRLGQTRLVRLRQSRKLKSRRGRVISHFLAHLSQGSNPFSLTVGPLSPRVVDATAQSRLVPPAGHGMTRAPPRSAASGATVDLPPIARGADAEEHTAPATAQQIQHNRRAGSAHRPSRESLGGQRGRYGGKLQSRFARLPPRSASRIRTPGGLYSHRDLSCARAYPIKPRDAPSARMMIGSLPEIGDYGAELRVSCWPFTCGIVVSSRPRLRYG